MNFLEFLDRNIFTEGFGIFLILLILILVGAIGASGKCS